MIKLMTIKQNLTYNSKEAVIDAVQDVFRSNTDIDLSYLIVNNEEGRFYPVFLYSKDAGQVKDLQNDFYDNVWQRYMAAHDRA